MTPTHLASGKDCRAIMQKMIDLTASADSTDSESEFFPTPSPVKKVKSELRDVQRAIKTKIATRQSTRLYNLRPRSSVASTNSNTVTPKKKSRKTKSEASHSKCNKKAKPSPSEKQIAHMHTQTCSKPATPISTPTATATRVPTPVATAMPVSAFNAAIPSQVPVVNAFYVTQSSFSPPTNPGVRRHISFHEELRQLTERIALNSDNTCGGLDGSQCDNAFCPYSTGTLTLQRYNMMVRTFQINHLLYNNHNLRHLGNTL